MPPIRPEVEALIRRRAAELAVAGPPGRVPAPERPRRRVALLSSMSAAAVAGVCAVLFLVLGSSSGTGLLSPQRAVAAVADSLESDGILHWVRRGDVVTSREEFEPPGNLIEEEWVDLKTGDTHRLFVDLSSGSGVPHVLSTWNADGREWMSTGNGNDGRPRVHRLVDRPADQALSNIVEQVRLSLARAERGEAEVSDVGEEGGVSVVVVTDRRSQAEVRTWITRERVPRVLRVTAAVSRGGSRRPGISTMETQSWRIHARTDATLAHVAIPAHAIRLP